MLKKIIRDILIIAGLFVLWASTSRNAMKFISDRRCDDSSWFGTYQGNKGDLVAFAYLDKVKKFDSRKPHWFKRPAYDGTGNLVLYLSGDSYTEKIPDTALAGLYAYKFGRRFRKSFEYTIDTSRQNLLVIQIAERYTRDYFGTTRIFQDVCKAVPGNNTVTSDIPEVPHAKYFPGLFTILNPDNFFNKNINQNLQYNLFNYNFIVPAMMYKALFNYSVFDRASGDVVISQDKKQLFYKETVTANDISSSYSPLSPEDITSIINNLNVIYDHYKADGFTDVYLSIIPSTASVMQPQWYNHFIPLVQKDPRLKMKIIDAYSVYSISPDKYFLPGDVHWNNDGMQVWISQLNKILESRNEQREGHLLK